ncbi:palmitoyltransferase ZDHHC23-A [Papilio machaon]|uniref:palmitoyltransferase ZDHHC23-A n=1 Tax=Papilio machaon TaxID=76193 RepID=UPI001E663408|nr:palmitoyltransferase ZDHHC23-A [Papilio machaon]
MTTITIQDVFCFGFNKSSNKKIDKDGVLPFIILPILLLFATVSLTITIIIMIVIGMGALYVQTRPRQKNRSPFFFSWTLSSGVWMFLVFEIAILRLLEITQLEHFVFLVLLACTCYSFYKVKAIADFELATGSSKGKEYSPVLTSDSHYCQVCQIEVNDRFFHSIWWNCCILRQNYIYFYVGQLFAFSTILYGTNLGLTTICQPFLLYGIILLPKDCQDVYFEFQLAISFVCCIYGLGYLCVVTLLLIRHLFVFIPKYMAPQWKKLVNPTV